MPLELIPNKVKATPEALFQAAQLLTEERALRERVQQTRLLMQDAWLLMYLLVDRGQDGQPASRAKHYTSRISSTVDTAQRVLARNPIKFHTVSQHFASQSRPEREPLRKLENVLHGVMYDIDLQMLERSELRARWQVAFHSLVRGAWAYKIHLSNKAKTSTGSPVYYQQLDPRIVLPSFDHVGVESAIGMDVRTAAQLLYEYPEEMGPVVETIRRAIAARSSRSRSSVGLSEDMGWLHAPVQITEWSSREEAGVLADFSTMPQEVLDALKIDKTEHSQARYFWLRTPYRHGFKRSLIQYGNVNGLPAGMSGQLGSLMAQSLPGLRMPLYQGGSETTGTVPQILLPNGSTYTPMAQTFDPMGMFSGRSIYSNIAHLIPELNTMTAVLKDAVLQEVRGTYVMKTRSGQLVNFEAGTGAVNPLQLNESVERLPVNIQAVDAMGVLQIISQEINDGTLDLRFILASESDAGGYLRARMEQAALISLEPYKDGVQNWARSVGVNFLDQYRRAPKTAFKGWQLTGRSPGAMTNFFVLDIDGEIDDMLREGKEPPVIEAVVKPSMPIDMMAKINMAKAAIDPSNPVMGLAMALDIILELDDADAAYDMIMEDIGNRNPTLQLINIANAFAQNNAPEVAQMILSDAFKNAFIQQTRGGSGQGGTPPSTSTPAGASPGIAPATMPPEQTTGGGTEATPRATGRG